MTSELLSLLISIFFIALVFIMISEIQKMIEGFIKVVQPLSKSLGRAIEILIRGQLSPSERMDITSHALILIFIFIYGVVVVIIGDKNSLDKFFWIGLVFILTLFLSLTFSFIFRYINKRTKRRT